MTHAQKTGASKLAPDSGACVIDITIYKSECEMNGYSGHVGTKSALGLWCSYISTFVCQVVLKYMGSFQKSSFIIYVM